MTYLGDLTREARADAIGGLPGVVVWGAANVPLHKHDHIHEEYLPHGLVKVIHSHWHTHTMLEALTQGAQAEHLGLHATFGPGDKPDPTNRNHWAEGVAPIVKDTVEGQETRS